MLELLLDLERTAPTELGLLIEGETGTGKELVAECVHQASARASGPFVTFDCSAVAASLAESELFGHERGAFTGAIAARPGVFEQAQGGTIFLDELGELPKSLQPKLLRVLEKREVRRVGGTRTISVDVRLVAATNRNLRTEVKRQTFREDLYFRVASARVYIPPLRERLEDLPLLVEHFLTSTDPSRTIADIPQELWQEFLGYRWPGNVRELKHAVQRLLITPDRVFEREPTSFAPPAPNRQNLPPLRVARREAVDSFELSYLKTVLEKAGGNVTRAAALAEVSRQAIHLLMLKHRLSAKSSGA